MPLLEPNIQKPILADDFAVWLAGISWSWKPQNSKITALGLQDKREVAGSKANSNRLPTPPISPQNSFLTTVSRSPPFIYSPPSSPPPPPLFTTDFFEVKPSPSKGLGAFATKYIAKGTVILSEKALFRAEFSEVFCAYENLNSQQRKEYRSLHSYSEVDEHILLAIFKTNRFEVSNSKSGIFIKSSRFNHACHPFATCTYFFNNDTKRLVTTAIHDIKAGQEITISYCGKDAPTKLPDNYGFYCDCPKCPHPEAAAAQARYLKDGGKKNLSCFGDPDWKVSESM